jgi:hypothetical protein
MERFNVVSFAKGFARAADAKAVGEIYSPTALKLIITNVEGDGRQPSESTVLKIQIESFEEPPLYRQFVTPVRVCLADLPTRILPGTLVAAGFQKVAQPPVSSP